MLLCCCCCSSVAQSSPTLCKAMDCSLPGSSAHGILQARMLEWVAMPSSRWTRRHAIFQARPLALIEPFPGRPLGRRGSGEAGAASQPVHRSPEKRRRHQGLSQSCSRTHVCSEPSSFISGSPYLTPWAMPCPGFSTEASLWRRRRKKLENSSLQYVCIPSSLSSPFPWPQSLLFHRSQREREEGESPFCRFNLLLLLSE